MKRARLYYTGVDADGEQSLTADQVHVEDAPDHVDTGLVDPYGRRIRRAVPRQPVGFYIKRITS